MTAAGEEVGGPTSRSARAARLPGVREPFEKVVQRHGPTVLRVCRAVLGPEDAQDAWSETFLSLLRVYPELAPATNLEAWLVTVAHRRSIDVIRARSRVSPVAQVPDAESPDKADARDLDLWAALAGLTEKQRAVVAYHYLAGLGYRDVAQIVGGTEAAARRAGADGVAALRRALGDKAEGGAA